MTDQSRDLTSPPDLVHQRRTGPARTERPVYRDILPPCNYAYPASEELQGWLAVGHMARQLDAVGADALVLFNRFYQPDFDLETRQVVPDLELSTPREIRLPLLWIAVLHGKLRASLAATTGVHSPVEIVKYVMAGADAVMTTSALLAKGIPFLRMLVTGLGDWGGRAPVHVGGPDAGVR